MRLRWSFWRVSPGIVGRPTEHSRPSNRRAVFTFGNYCCGTEGVRSPSCYTRQDPVALCGRTSRSLRLLVGTIDSTALFVAFPFLLLRWITCSYNAYNRRTLLEADDFIICENAPVICCYMRWHSRNTGRLFHGRYIFVYPLRTPRWGRSSGGARPGPPKGQGVVPVGDLQRGSEPSSSQPPPAGPGGLRQAAPGLPGCGYQV